MEHWLANPETYKGKQFVNAKGNAECVEFVKQALNAPVTSLWREGRKIVRLAKGESDVVQRGTAIATFVGGLYPQQGSTGKHAAIYLGQDVQGIQVMDQWRAQGQVLPRTIPWAPHRPGLSNDGGAFSAIEW